jgi:hypothetical protein
MAEKRPTNDEQRTKNERTDWSEFSTDWSEFRTIGPNPNDWSEFRTIGPNSERLVRIPKNWVEFWTNDEFDVATALNVLT